MPQFITVAKAESFKSGDRIVVEIGERYIAVFMVGGNFYAIEDVCTHDDGPLAEGELNAADLIVECPRHGAQFDLTTGRSLSLIAPRPVATFPVRVENGDVQVEV